MARFSGIALENWRNFASVEVELQERVFVVGANASGKSNLLDAFRFLHDVATEGMRKAVLQRGGVSAIRSDWANADADVAIRASLRDDAGRKWSYALRMTQDPQGQVVVHKERVRSGARVILDRPDADDRDDPRRRSQTALEQVVANKAFRSVADFFSSIRSYDVVPEAVRGVLHPPSKNGQSGDPDLIRRIVTVEPELRSNRLRMVGKALQAAAPQILELAIEWERGEPHLRGRFDDGTAQGVWRSEEAFSDGTLRLLGLLWVALEEGGPLLIEEPEQSIHPAVVPYIPAMLVSARRVDRRQTIVATHSPDLLMDEGIGLDEVFLLRSSGHGTTVLPVGASPTARALLESGMPLGEIVIPMASPSAPDRLLLLAS